MQDDTTKKSKSFPTKKVAYVFAALVVTAVAVGATYAWQQSKVDQLSVKTSSLKADLARSETKTEQLTQQLQTAKQPKETATQPAAPAQSDDQQVLAATKDLCNAQVTPGSGAPKVFEAVSAAAPGQMEKMVRYSQDKMFAIVNGNCSDAGVRAIGGAAYYLKKTNGKWLVFTYGQSSDPAVTKLFGAPAANAFN